MAPLSSLTAEWREYHEGAFSATELERLRRHERTGRPLGAESFVRGWKRSCTVGLFHALPVESQRRKNRNEYGVP
jgi:hypothetical protein